jgi:hypothetical protein
LEKRGVPIKKSLPRQSQVIMGGRIENHVDNTINVPVGGR